MAKINPWRRFSIKCTYKDKAASDCYFSRREKKVIRSTERGIRRGLRSFREISGIPEMTNE